MSYSFDIVPSRVGSGCFKYDALKPLYGRDDLISLWVADMDFPVADCIKNAMQARLDHGVFGYNYRMQPYYDAVIGWQSRRHGWQIEQDWIVNTPGIVPAINMAVLALTQPGDRVLVHTPAYRPFFNAVTDHDRCLLTSSLTYSHNHYSIDYDDFEKKIQQSTLFILCNPHNPTGRVWNADELTIIGDLCTKHNVPIISDEIHADIVFDGFKHIPIAKIDDFSENVITCVSPAKSFNIAGLCSAAIIIKNPRLRKKIADMNEHLHLYLGNSFGITAVEAAYTQGDAWIADLMTYLDANREYLKQHIATEIPMLRMIDPESTYLAWIDFSELNMDDNALFEFLTNKARLALDPGRKFGVDGSGFSRLNFGCPRSILVEAMDRLKRAIMES